jgi:hypothetical protein
VTAAAWMRDDVNPRTAQHRLAQAKLMGGFVPAGDGSHQGFAQLEGQALEALQQEDGPLALGAARLCLTEARRLLDAVRDEREEMRREQARQADLRFALDSERAHSARLESEVIHLRERLVGLMDQAARRTKPREMAADTVADLELDLRPDPRAAETAAAFMECLREFKLWSGNPGFRQIAARAGNRYTGAALQAALARGKLPKKLEIVDTIVAGCGASDDDRRMWATAWRRLAMRPEPGEPSEGQPGPS